MVEHRIGHLHGRATKTASNSRQRLTGCDPPVVATGGATGFPATTTAGASKSFTVSLRDVYGNVATGYTGAVHFSTSDGQASLPADYKFVTADAGD